MLRKMNLQKRRVYGVPMRETRDFIIIYILSHKCKARREDVLKAFYDKFSARLTRDDWECRTDIDDTPEWHHRIDNARMQLKKLGVIGGKKRGIWTMFADIIS